MNKQDFYQLMLNALDLPEGFSLSPETNIVESWDSLKRIGVLSMLDQEFGVTLTMDDLNGIKTVQDVIDILKSADITLE